MNQNRLFLLQNKILIEMRNKLTQISNNYLSNLKMNCNNIQIRKTRKLNKRLKDK